MTDLTLDVHTSPMVDLPNGGMFSPTTSTLVLGPTEAALVDTQYLPADVEAVADAIERSGRNLTTIFVTHGHFDHYFGLETLLGRFPAARAVATAAVAREIAAGLNADREHARSFFHPGTTVDNTVVPEALDGDAFTVDGVELRIIELPQADINPTAAVHIPSIDAVIAGDAIYNGINPMLARASAAERPKWLESVAIIAGLKPTIVVAGHKRPELPDDAAAAIDGTRGYIQTFIEGVESQANTRSLVEYVQSRYPDHGNPSALLLSAATAMRAKKEAR